MINSLSTELLDRIEPIKNGSESTHSMLDASMASITQMLEDAIVTWDLEAIEELMKNIGRLYLRETNPEMYMKMLQTKREAREKWGPLANGAVNLFYDQSTYNNRGTTYSVAAAARGMEIPQPIAQLAHADETTEKKSEEKKRNTHTVFSQFLRKNIFKCVRNGGAPSGSCIWAWKPTENHSLHTR